MAYELPSVQAEHIHTTANPKYVEREVIVLSDHLCKKHCKTTTTKTTTPRPHTTTSTTTGSTTSTTTGSTTSTTTHSTTSTTTHSTTTGPTTTTTPPYPFLITNFLFPNTSDLSIVDIYVTKLIPGASIGGTLLSVPNTDQFINIVFQSETPINSTDFIEHGVTVDGESDPTPINPGSLYTATLTYEETDDPKSNSFYFSNGIVSGIQVMNTDFSGSDVTSIELRWAPNNIDPNDPFLTGFLIFFTADLGMSDSDLAAGTEPYSGATFEGDNHFHITINSPHETSGDFHNPLGHDTYKIGVIATYETPDVADTTFYSPIITQQVTI